jgi:hypothetical protein
MYERPAVSTNRLQCVECGRVSRENERGWTARLTVDRASGVVHVRRVYTDGQVKLYGKQTRLLRTVPLPLRAAQALEGLPPRLDTHLLFPGQRGGHLTCTSGGPTSRRPPSAPPGSSTARPTRSGTPTRRSRSRRASPLFELARFMGTSVEQIDRT